MTAVHVACYRHFMVERQEAPVRLLRDLLRLGGDVRVGDLNGDTPAHHVCFYGAAVEKLKVLAEAGANLDAQNEVRLVRGATAWWWLMLTTWRCTCSMGGRR